MRCRMVGLLFSDAESAAEKNEHGAREREEKGGIYRCSVKKLRKRKRESKSEKEREREGKNARLESQDEREREDVARLSCDVRER